MNLFFLQNRYKRFIRKIKNKIEQKKLNDLRKVAKDVETAGYEIMIFEDCHIRIKHHPSRLCYAYPKHLIKEICSKKELKELFEKTAQQIREEINKRQYEDF